MTDPTRLVASPAARAAAIRAFGRSGVPAVRRPTYWRTWRGRRRTTSRAGDAVHLDRCPVIPREYACTPWHELNNQPHHALRALVAIDPLLDLCAVCFGATPARPGERMPSSELARTNDLAGMSLAEQLQAAEQLANAGLLPDAYRRQPANVLLAMQYASMQQIPTMAAILGVHVIEGRQSPSADLVQALVRRAGHRIRVGTSGTGDRVVGWAEIVRRDDPGHTYRSEWSVDRADKAGLVQPRPGKGPTNWQKHPVAMVKRRAVSEVAHDACPEVLLGLDIDADVIEQAPPADDVLNDATTAPVAPAEDDVADAEIVEPDRDTLRGTVWREAGRLWPNLNPDKRLAEVEGEFAGMFDGLALRDASLEQLDRFGRDLVDRIPATNA